MRSFVSKRKKSDLQGNEQQQKAIAWNTGPALILAGPGSGKTFTIVERVRYLIEVRNVDPSHILVITFTKAAARQMRDRFFSRMEGTRPPVSFGTFHAVFFHILIQSGRYRCDCVLNDREKREFLCTVLQDPAVFCPEGGMENRDWQEGLLAEFSCLKNQGSAPETFRSAYLEPAVFQTVFLRFQRLLSESGKLDLDDFAQAVRHLFLTRPHILAEWRKRFAYLLVDEFQDINAAQYEAVKLLAGDRENLFVVGDDDQAIYGFRGSDPSVMRRFLSDYPQAVRIDLSVNYRSRPGIVGTAERLISVNTLRMPKRIRAGREAKQKDAGEDRTIWRRFSKDGSVRLAAFSDRRQQAKEIADRIHFLVMQEQPPGSVAAIFRTNGDAALLAEELSKRKIPFAMKEKLKSPYAHPVCQDLLAYLEFAKQRRSRELFFRIMNRPCRYLSRRAANQEQIRFSHLREFYRDKPYMGPILERFCRDIDRVAVMDPYAGVHYVRKGMGYDQWIKQEFSGDAYREAVAMADFFQESARGFLALPVLKEHIREYEEALRKGGQSDGAQKKPGERVSLLTLHGSKGLEYDAVFLPDCNEGIVPHKKSEKKEELEEERRMFYVGITRAKEELYLSWVGGTREEPGVLSRFLADLGYREPYRQ